MIVKAFKMMIEATGSANMKRTLSSNDVVGGRIKFMREMVKADAVKRVKRLERRTAFESFLIRYNNSAFLERDAIPAIVASSSSLIPISVRACFSA